MEIIVVLADIFVEVVVIVEDVVLIVVEVRVIVEIVGAFEAAVDVVVAGALVKVVITVDIGERNRSKLISVASVTVAICFAHFA